MPIRRNAVHAIGDTPLVNPPVPVIPPDVPATGGDSNHAAPPSTLPLSIDRDTPIRKIGSVAPLVVRGVLEYAKSPAMADFDDVYAAIKPHAVAMLAIMAKETEYGRTATAAHNGWNVIDGSGGFTAFSSWGAGALSAVRRLTDLTYKGGIYEDDISVAEFMQTWQGGPRCRTTRYRECAHGETKESIEESITQFLDRANRIRVAGANVSAPPVVKPPVVVPPVVKPPTEKPAVTFGRVPAPSNYAENIIAPDGVNGAFDYLGARKPRGLILHRMLGTLIGTNAYFQAEARNRALTDFGIGKGADGRRGRVIRWTKPGAGIAPWASGPADGIDGDATAFYNKYRGDPVGVSIFNRDCESIEIEGQYADALPPDDYAALVELVAWRADGWLKIPYWQWPINNDGVHCLLGHSEVTDQKPCAGAVVYAAVPRLITDVAARMKKYQVV